MGRPQGYWCRREPAAKHGPGAAAGTPARITTKNVIASASSTRVPSSQGVRLFPPVAPINAMDKAWRTPPTPPRAQCHHALPEQGWTQHDSGQAGTGEADRNRRPGRQHLQYEMVRTTRRVYKKSIRQVARETGHTRGWEISDFQETLGGLRRLVDQRNKESDSQSRIYCSIVVHVCFPSDCL